MKKRWLSVHNKSAPRKNWPYASFYGVPTCCGDIRREDFLPAYSVILP